MSRWAAIVVIAALTSVAWEAQGAPAPRAASPSTPAAASPAVAATQPAAQLGKMLGDLDSQSTGRSVVQWIVLVTVMAIAPAILVLVTCFTRIVVVLGLLRQGLATQSLPPNQVLFGLALLMTVVVMSPVFSQVHSDALAPYLAGRMNAEQALAAGEKPVRAFMIRQMDAAHNGDDVYLFLNDQQAAKADLTWADVPTLSLIPAYVVSELKIAFIMGFKILLPFLIIDMLVSSVLISMGMLMLPPVLISLPFKLLLFVLANGWNLVVGTLMKSFG